MENGKKTVMAKSTELLFPQRQKIQWESCHIWFVGHKYTHQFHGEGEYSALKLYKL